LGQASGWRPQIAWSMGDGLALDPPPGNYNWLPSYADPTDKTVWEAWFTVPSSRAVSSGGVRVDTLNIGDGTTTWHYRLDQPVSTYLLFVAISDYRIMVQRESNPCIENFIYPSCWNQAQIDFSNVPTVIDSFAARFGTYPFERFGYAMTRTLGDMEHATCVCHYDGDVVGNLANEWILYHEMSHMWWGDWVTCGDWRDLWLNEGFATYCEPLSMEMLYGRDAYRNYMRDHLFHDALTTTENFPIYDPDYY
jgi:aminopeptidase N